MDIIKLRPVFKDYIWGGNRLKSQFNYDTEFDKTAEAWVLSTHADGVCETENGMPLTEILDLPILIKLIDAKDNLSVQVHPNNEYALKNENEPGKTEAWYVIDADEDAKIVYGFKDKLSKAEFKSSIESNTLLDKLNAVKAKAGDVFFIEAGTVHAIGKGVLIAEIQQCSNTTYRVYDYGRVDKNGNARPLHIDKALDVAITDKPLHPIKNTGNEVNTEQSIAKCEYFNVSRYIIDKEFEFNADIKSFNHILVLNGNGKINEIKIKKGDSIFIPSGYGKYTINGKIEFLLTKI